MIDLSHFHMTRRAMVWRLLVASSFAPAMVAMVSQAAGNSKVPVVPGIQTLSGDVRLNGHKAVLGQEVKPGDTVTTGDAGDCVIIIGEHVYLIHEHSEVTFYAEDFTAGLEGDVSGDIVLAVGAMLSVFGPTNTTLTTPTATIGIRGTACYLEVQPDKTYACICYGRGELSGSQDGRHLETITTTYHDSPRYIYAKSAPKRIEEAPVIHHTDAELKMLEALVNRKAPFDKGEYAQTGGRY